MLATLLVNGASKLHLQQDQLAQACGNPPIPMIMEIFMSFDAVTSCSSQDLRSKIHPKMVHIKILMKGLLYGDVRRVKRTRKKG